MYKTKYSKLAHQAYTYLSVTIYVERQTLAQSPSRTYCITSGFVYHFRRIHTTWKMKVHSHQLQKIQQWKQTPETDDRTLPTDGIPGTDRTNQLLTPIVDIIWVKTPIHFSPAQWCWLTARCVTFKRDIDCTRYAASARGVRDKRLNERLKPTSEWQLSAYIQWLYISTFWCAFQNNDTKVALNGKLLFLNWILVFRILRVMFFSLSSKSHCESKSLHLFQEFYQKLPNNYICTLHPLECEKLSFVSRSNELSRRKTAWLVQKMKAISQLPHNIVL